MFTRFLALLAAIVIRLIGRLLRYRFIDRHHSALAEQEGAPVLYAFWHGRQLMLLNYPVPRPMAQMVSLSKDGDLQAEILRLLGFAIVRGSPAKRGREALYEMSDMVLNGYHAALAVDGSRGPIGVVKPGILHLARDTGGRIIPLAAAAKRKTILERAWDKYQIPWPLSSVVVVEGDPIDVDADASDDDLERLRLELESSLNALHTRAERMAAGLADEDEEELRAA